MPITEALKKLIKTITGKNAVGETIEELVTNLNDNYPEGGSGGGDIYETVLEMQLGEPITGEGIPEWATAFDVSSYETEIRLLADEQIPIFISSNSYEYGEKIELAYLDENWTKNCTVSAQGITWDEPNEDCFVLSKAGFIFASNVNFSNTTVRILKKVSGGGGETITVDNELKADSENPVQNMVITAALAAKGDDFHVILTETDDVLSCENATIADIVAAARAMKNVFATVDDGTGILRMPLVYAMSGLVQFGCVILDYDGSTWSAVPSGIRGEVKDGADSWTSVGG